MSLFSHKNICKRFQLESEEVILNYIKFTRTNGLVSFLFSYEAELSNFSKF